jgi:hypothetical protein
LKKLSYVYLVIYDTNNSIASRRLTPHLSFQQGDQFPES